MLTDYKKIPCNETERSRRTGYVQIYTGNGKGKTTAAFGLALRAAGNGLSVFFAQFLKEGRHGEIRALDTLDTHITWRQYGRSCFVEGVPKKSDIGIAEQGMNEVCNALISGAFDVVILDELNIAVHFGLIALDDVLLLLEKRPEHVELILTGRCAHPSIMDHADLVTEMQEVRHYYQKGVMARKGIEY